MCAFFVALAGLVVGWRPDNGVLGLLAGFGVALFFGYALSWFGACIGLGGEGTRSRPSRSGSSSCSRWRSCRTRSCPTNNLPALARHASPPGTRSAPWRAAVRELWGNPNPSSTIAAWPMQHPVAAALIWSAVILGVCTVIATRLFKRRTTE